MLHEHAAGFRAKRHENKTFHVVMQSTFQNLSSLMTSATKNLTDPFGRRLIVCAALSVIPRPVAGAIERLTRC